MKTLDETITDAINELKADTPRLKAAATLQAVCNHMKREHLRAGGDWRTIGEGVLDGMAGSL